MAENEHERNVEQFTHGSPAPRIQPDLNVPENRHEHRDVNVFALGKFAIGLVIVTIFCVGLVAGVFQYLLHREGGIPASRMETPAQDARQLPPEPRLEETPNQRFAGNAHGGTEDSNQLWLARPIGGHCAFAHRPRYGSRGAARTSRARPSPVFNRPRRSVSVPTASGLGPIMQQAGGPLAPQIQKGGIMTEGGK